MLITPAYDDASIPSPAPVDAWIYSQIELPMLEKQQLSHLALAAIKQVVEG